jgi:DNA-binding response OmpR family regulator
MAAQANILLVDDDAFFRTLLKQALQAGAFTFREVADGQAALEEVRRAPPDLIISDYQMPVMDGIALIRRLKEHAFWRHIPVLMLTSHDEIETTVAGLEAGADDYLHKGFRAPELLARVTTQLRRRERELSADPLTELPSGLLIRRELEERIQRAEPFAAIYLDLDHFKAFVDRYGFVRAGDVVSRTAQLLYQAVWEVAGAAGFVGHIAGDDFLAVCAPAQAEDVCQRLITAFDRVMPEYYDPADRQQGYLTGRDRDGHPRRFPLLTVSLCVVSTEHHPVKSAGEVADLAFAVRPRAKAQAGSCYVIA